MNNMKETGIITIKKISENEFTYEWDFSRIRENVSYRSPTFGTICYEFSDCYLKAKYDCLTSKYAMIISLIGCNSSSTISSASLLTLVKGVFYPRPHNLENKGALKSSTKIFEFSMSTHLFLVSKKFVFALQIKVNEDLTSTPEPSLMLQENESHNKPSSSPVNEESKNKPYVDDPKELIQDLKSFFSSGNMCDLEIRIGENILRAHKFMLCARSPVFTKIMEHDCLESSSNSITITDCSAVPFKKFLTYLYTGEIEDRSVYTVMPLYSLGDKYDVPALRNACSRILQNKLSEPVDGVANIICDILKLADFHNDVKLKDLAASFIVKHFPVVSNKQCWTDLMNSDFKLTSEVLALVVTACQKTKT